MHFFAKSTDIFLFYTTMYCTVLKNVVSLYSSFDFRLTINILYYCILSIISRQEVYTSDILEALHKADLLVVEAINLTGASKIEYQGNPSVQQSISLGASKIHRN